MNFTLVNAVDAVDGDHVDSQGEYTDPQSRLRGHGEHQSRRRRNPGRATDLATSEGNGPKWRRSAIVPNPNDARGADNG
eukprot:4053273-Pleurochrysis_carterae.AAC.1